MSSIEERVSPPSVSYDADRKSYRRREDYRLTVGQGAFVDDFREINGRTVLHLLIVRSPYAHAIVKDLHLEAIRALPGIVAVYAGSELASEFSALGTFPLPGLKIPERFPLATNRVRYAGDSVAAILAENQAAGEDAVNLLNATIEYESLPTVSDPEAALEANAPLLYDEFGSNVAFTYDMDTGDVAGAFERADKIVRLRVVNQRIAPASLEPRSSLYDFDPQTGKLNAWLSTQAAYRAKGVLAGQLKIPVENVRVRVADVGGGFGSKTGFNGEELVAAWASKKFGRPVKWVEGRSENFQSQTHGRGQINYIEAAVRKDGKLLGLRVNTVADLGAWLAGATPMVPTGTPRMLNGPYAIEAISTRVVGVFTNKVPTSAYRGAGRPEAAYILERTMQRIAAELNLDPVQVRMLNFIPPEAFPYKALTGVQYDSGNYAAGLNKAVELLDYDYWKSEQQSRRAQNSPRQIGIGFATYLETAGGPGMAGPQEAATVLVNDDGSVTVLSGVATNGQGHYTAFAQVAAGILGLPIEKVEVQMGDTDLPAYGIGTFGSRTTPVAASAVFKATEAVRNRLLQGAARLLEASESDLELDDGKVSVRGVPSSSVDFATIAQAEPDKLISERRDFNPAGPTFPSGAHIAILEVDTETGDIAILKYVAVDDCGRVLNELLADGQVHGSLAQGISQALYEEIVYDDNGQLLSATLMDYTLPTAEQLPEFVTGLIETPSPLNPLGAKGVGESGCTGAPPAIVNAALDALAPLGVTELDMPLRPERLWQAISAARSGTTRPERIPNVALFTRQTTKKEADGSYVFE